MLLVIHFSHFFPTIMSKVTITPIKGQTALINQFQNSTDKGYIKLSQTVVEFGIGWAKPITRTCLMKGELSVLQLIVQSSSKLELPGKIVLREFVESEVPAEMAKEFYNQDEPDHEKMVKSYVKTTGGENPITLTLDGERIFRFAFYDQSGTSKDVLVRHDNGQHIKDMRAAEKLEAAALPGSGD